MAPYNFFSHWRSNEVSVARESFNSIVSGKKRGELDVSEVLMKHNSLGRQAEMGPGWAPSGIVSRRIANLRLKEFHDALEVDRASAPGQQFARRRSKQTYNPEVVPGYTTDSKHQ